MSENLLGQETSPYLLQHADNPVHWQPWGTKALAAAKESNKPILLSVGYAACHWCHVMAHESFENEDIAALMNDHFINIKVDREERPDIDAIYQAALAGLGQQGGWPLTMFLTPDGEPFWGGTYFPPDERYGRPGFATVLSRLSQVFQTDMDTVEQNRQALIQHLSGSDRATANDAYLPPDCLSSTAEQLINHIDVDKGGLGGAPKFPNIPVFELLWRTRLETDIPEYGRATEHTLERMCEGGIYDHLGGGFARYSVDADWFAPHFEKMLYDNAQILELMGLVWQRHRDPLLHRRIHETVEWLLRDMIAENGALLPPWMLTAKARKASSTSGIWQKLPNTWAPRPTISARYTLCENTETGRKVAQAPIFSTGYTCRFPLMKWMKRGWSPCGASSDVCAIHAFTQAGMTRSWPTGTG